MSVLDTKMWRDLNRLKTQALAVSLVIGCGVATLVLALGAYRSLDQTRSAFYDRYQFPTVFASANRVPASIQARLTDIPGVSRALLRIRKPVLLDMPDLEQPATGIVVSIPDDRNDGLARLYLRSGRLPFSAAEDEVAVLESFALAHALSHGDTVVALINGRKRHLRVVGIVVSPEYIYAMGPGDMVPDPERFGVLYLHERALGSLFDMRGVFNDIALSTYRQADLRRITDALDALLESYGGTGAHGRSEQMSHAFLDSELVGLKAMSAVIPPIFLLISAFLVNMIMTRLIALEREHIGLLKAMGFGNLAVTLHYVKLVVVIAVVGFLIGALAGTWLGQALTELYGEFFSFPFLIFDRSADLYLLSLIVAVASAVAGAVRAIWKTVRLAPAVAMSPPAPTRYRALFGSSMRPTRIYSQLDIMAVRHLLRWPVRTIMTITGIALSVSLLVTALFMTDSVDFMIDTIFFQSNRQDATITFSGHSSPAALQAVAALPGVIRVEGFRATPVVVHHGAASKRLSLTGVEPGALLSRSLDRQLKPFQLPTQGVLVSDSLAGFLDVRQGDLLDVELLERDHIRVRVPVAGILRDYVGLTVHAHIDTVQRLLRHEHTVSGAHIALDNTQATALYRSIKQTPGIAGIALLRVSLQQFRETIRKNITISTTVYILLAIIITFGVVYNSARIQLSERARELASLRVLGFTRAEVSSVLVLELVILVLIAQPLGWLIGYGFAWSVVQGFDSDLYRIPFIIDRSTFAIASLVVLIAATVSIAIVRRRIDHLDMIEVLKTRE